MAVPGIDIVGPLPPDIQIDDGVLGRAFRPTPRMSKAPMR